MTPKSAGNPLRLFVSTWNQGDTETSKNLAGDWIPTDGSVDIFCIGTQESPLGKVNRTMDVVFLADMAVNFVLITEGIDAEEFLEDVLAEGFEPDEAIFVGCRKGPRSAMACEVLIDAGFTGVVNVEGGIQEWVARDLPIQPFTG